MLLSISAWPPDVLMFAGVPYLNCCTESVVSFHDCTSSIVVVSEVRGAKSLNSLCHFEWSHLPL